MANDIENEEGNPQAKAAILEVIENQLRGNNPPQTRETLKRLMADGSSREDAKIYIAQALCVELWDAGRKNKPFDLQRYLRNLKNLPNEPAEV